LSPGWWQETSILLWTRLIKAVDVCIVA
jgi:hypothetical protein